MRAVAGNAPRFICSTIEQHRPVRTAATGSNAVFSRIGGNGQRIRRFCHLLSVRRQIPVGAYRQVETIFVVILFRHHEPHFVSLGARVVVIWAVLSRRRKLVVPNHVVRAVMAPVLRLFSPRPIRSPRQLFNELVRAVAPQSHRVVHITPLVAAEPIVQPDAPR